MTNNTTINNDGEFESYDPSLPYGVDMEQLWIEAANDFDRRVVKQLSNKQLNFMADIIADEMELRLKEKQWKSIKT